MLYKFALHVMGWNVTPVKRNAPRQGTQFPNKPKNEGSDTSVVHKFPAVCKCCRKPSCGIGVLSLIWHTNDWTELVAPLADVDSLNHYLPRLP